MANIKFNLTVDSMFDFCEVLEAIGIDSVTEEFSKEDLEAFKNEDAGSVGMTDIKLSLTARRLLTVPPGLYHRCACKTFFQIWIVIIDVKCHCKYFLFSPVLPTPFSHYLPERKIKPFL